MINKREKTAALATFLLWLVLVVIGDIALSIKHTKNNYKTISIQLVVPDVTVPQKVETLPIMEEAQSAPAKSASLQAKAISAPTKAVPEPTKSAPVPAPAKTVSASIKATQKAPVPQKLQKSMEDLIAEQNAASNKKDVDAVDWDSMFADSSSVASSSSVQETDSASTVLTDSEALSGSVAASATDTGASATSATSTTNARASESTTNALSAIGSANFSDAGTGRGVTSTVSVVSNSGKSGGTSIKMSDGSMRKLLDPLEPVLTISSENEKLVDSSITVTIKFTVKADGNVLPTTIKFMPSGLLPLAVQLDLGLQITKWRFEKGTGDGQAEFKYSINKQ